MKMMKTNIVTNLENLGIHALKLTAALSREERYLNYLQSLKGSGKGSCWNANFDFSSFPQGSLNNHDL
jgi:hypothetical protein